MQSEPEGAEVFPAELLATVGHEFRGPLTTIQGYATTLLHHEQRLTLEERQDFLRAISEASAHLGRLIDRFLELALLETSRHTFVEEPVNLQALALESITAVQKSTPRHFLLLPSSAQRVIPEGNLPMRITDDELALSGDRRLLRTMLDILLENAVSYSAPESLVEISIDPTDGASALADAQAPPVPGKHRELIVPARFQKHERLLALNVRDHGIGIEPIHLSMIFQRFYRVDTSLTREANGLGLGLALCKAIVILHGGMLRVESMVGEGSTFSIILPCERTSGSVSNA